MFHGREPILVFIGIMSADRQTECGPVTTLSLLKKEWNDEPLSGVKHLHQRYIKTFWNCPMTHSAHNDAGPFHTSHLSLSLHLSHTHTPSLSLLPLCFSHLFLSHTHTHRFSPEIRSTHHWTPTRVAPSHPLSLSPMWWPPCQCKSLMCCHGNSDCRRRHYRQWEGAQPGC